MNEIISLLSARVGQPFNVPLQEQLKVVVNYKRVNYTQQFLEKHPEQRSFFQQSFVTDMEQVNPGDCDEIPVEITCDVMKSKCKIPQPIRSSTALFDFVGASDWTVGYGESMPEFVKYFKRNKYTPTLPKWMYMNEYLYLFNDLTIKKLAVRGVFADPYSVVPCCGTGSKPCITDDTPYPMSQDILNAIIRDTLNVELRNIFPQPGVVSVPESKDTNVPATT
jgi:hypothetical protein